MDPDDTPKSELILYTDDAGNVRVQVRAEEATVWLTQRQMAELYQVSVPTINEHLSGIYDDEEVEPSSTIRKFRIVQTEGERSVSRLVDHYALPAILAVGYRVRSSEGTRFRQWATSLVAGFLIKGFVLDDPRLKNPPRRGQPAPEIDYFEELLARIRDVRSSEKLFYQKVLDIYAEANDYDPKHEATQKLFRVLQNKMHFAAHGHTAAEVVIARADATLPNMGLTSWAGARPRKHDVTIAKNYLNEEELEALNRIVTLYLEFAEVQAMNRKTMKMADYLEKLDELLQLSQRGVLTHAGSVSHDAATAAAHLEYEKFATLRRNAPTRIEAEFEAAIESTKRLSKERAPRPRKK